MLKPGKNLFDDFGSTKSKIQQSNRLLELEQQINLNFFAAAEALKEIKESKLYLQVADTWEEYCKERLGRSVFAVREQLKMLEISREVNRCKATERALPMKDLRKRARNVPMETIRPKAPEPASDFKAHSGKILPQTQFKSQPEEKNLLEDLITRIRRAENNRAFLKALEEWLDESGM